MNVSHTELKDISGILTLLVHQGVLNSYDFKVDTTATSPY